MLFGSFTALNPADLVTTIHCTACGRTPSSATLIASIMRLIVAIQDTWSLLGGRRSFLVFRGHRLRTKDDIHLLMYRSKLVVSTTTSHIATMMCATNHVYKQSLSPQHYFKQTGCVHTGIILFSHHHPLPHTHPPYTPPSTYYHTHP